MEDLAQKIRERLEENTRFLRDLEDLGRGFFDLRPVVKMDGTYEGRKLVWLLVCIVPDEPDAFIALIDQGDGEVGIVKFSFEVFEHMHEEGSAVMVFDETFVPTKDFGNYHIQAIRLGYIKA